MFSRNNRYNDYYLVNDMEIEDIGFDAMQKPRCSRKCKIISTSIFIFLLLFATAFVFVGVPLIFKNSISLQRNLIFTHFGLPVSKQYFKTYRLPGYRNTYLRVKDLDGKNDVSLGVWQMLPVELTYKALYDKKFNYREALLNSNYSVLLYFHGTGEARSDNTRKYQLLRQYFHVIAFDYRSYADSSDAVLSEKAVINDCLQLYRWLVTKTNSSIYIWGHSLGASLATSTVSALTDSDIYPDGLILESAFTNLRDELYVHRYGKIFSWLPWFEKTIVKPLHNNGFIFDTETKILNVTCPIMILHAEDDNIVPYQFGEKLFKIADNRQTESPVSTIYHQFKEKLGYNHYFIYQDPYVKYYIMDFIGFANNNETNATIESSETIDTTNDTNETNETNEINVRNSG